MRGRFVPTDFTLPELGENISTGDVLRVLVKPGDAIEKEQPILELETDKATIEVPSSVAGQVKEIKVKAGDKVKVGQAILSVDEGGASAQPASASGATSQRQTDDKDKSETKEKADAARKIPDEGAQQQHVEGKRPQAADKSGVIEDQQPEARIARSLDRKSVV